MALPYQSEFVFIGKGDDSFLENYSYELRDDPEGTGGKVFMALEILNNQAEAEDIGEAVFSNFKQKFYEDTKLPPHQRFEEALKEANGVIEILKGEKASRFIGNLNIAIGVIVDNTLYISTAGDAEVYLVRKRFVSIVSEGLAEESEKETFVNIANGTLEPFDTVLFASSRLLRYITKGEMGKIFSGIGPSHIGEALGELQDFIMTEILGRSSVIGISIGQAGEENQVAEEGGIFEGEKVGESRWKSLLKKLIPSKSIKMPERLTWLRKVEEWIKGILPERASAQEEKSKIPKIRTHEPMGKEKILILIIVLLVILVGGIFWIRTRGDQQRMIQEQQTHLNHVRELINEASTVGQFDKEKAAELLSSGEKETMDVLNSNYLRGEAVKTLDDIQKFRDTLDDVKHVSDPTLLADLSAKRSTVSAIGLLNLKDRIFSFEYNALYEMVLDKLQDLLTISDVETVVSGASYLDKSTLLFLTRTGKMIEYADGRFATVSTKDGLFKEGVDMKTYNNRLYILDKKHNQIWRYTRRSDGFDAGEAYIQNGDVATAASFAIDSSIYVLNENATIAQFYQGQKQTYTLRRSPLTQMTAPTRIFTTSDLNHLFILEPSRNRVVVFRKDPKNGGAQYQTQYIFDKLSGLRDLIVADNRLYVMDDKRVYFVNLSGL